MNQDASNLDQGDTPDDTEIPGSPLHLCPECEYNLTGLREHRCPECGSPFEPFEAREKARELSKQPEGLLTLIRFQFGLAMLVVGLIIFTFLTNHGLGACFWYLFIVSSVFLVVITRFSLDIGWDWLMLTTGALFLITSVLSMTMR